MGRRILQVGAGVFLGLVAALLLVPLMAPEAASPTPEDPHLLAVPYPAPESRLVDQDGRETLLPGDFDGLTAVFFGYTACPDVCPMTMASLAAVRARLEPHLGARFRAILVSVDPERDTPERLGEYLARFDSTFVGLTGSSDALRATAEAWGVWSVRADAGSGSGTSGDAAGERQDGGGDTRPDTTGGMEADPHAHHGSGTSDPAARGYLVDHTARSFLVGPDGRVVATFPASTAPDAMLPTVRALLGGGG